ncbi:MAG: hypothetical protein ACE5OS_02235 [Anaerolineae bacterium]
MTLILTHLNRYGIIHASDSSLTAGDMDAGQGQKTFEVPFLNAGLTVAGAFSVGREEMDIWMNDFIQSQASVNGLTLSGFAHRLESELQSRMLPGEKDGGSMVHIAGYAKEGNTYHPEFWFISNVHAIDRKTGEYGGIDYNFKSSEDFWTRDCPENNLMKRFQEHAGAYQIYVNGFAPGRISYVFLQRVMNEFLRTVWGNPNWKFRPPQSLKETEILVKMYIQVIINLFLLSDYSARFIGGEPQIYAIPQPENVVTSC